MQFNKRVIVIAGMTTFIAVLALCLVACNNREGFEKRLKVKDYVVLSITEEQLENITGDDIEEYEWAIIATKGSIPSGDADYVFIVKLYSESDAKDFEKKMREEEESLLCERNGEIVIFGTEQAVKDAK